MMALLIEHKRAVHLLFIMVLLGGYLSLIQLGREELPEPEDDYEGVLVTSVWAGASPDEVDRQLARPIHSAIKGMAGVKEVDSESREGFLRLRVRFDRDMPDPAGLIRDISQRINQITDFPNAAEGPYVNAFRSKLWEDMTLLFVGGDDLGRHQQWRWVSEQLRQVQGLAELDVTGDRERRVEVKLDGLKAAFAGTRIDQLAASLGNALAEQAAGRIDSTMDVHQLKVLTRPESIDELSALRLPVQGEQRRLSSLAQVDEALEPANVAVSYQGEGAWYVRVYREPGSNIEALSEQLRLRIETINQQLGSDYQLVLMKDRSILVGNSFADLQFAILTGIALVLVVLWLFVGLRNAFYAALGIPFAFMASFMVMQQLGLNLNVLTLFGLILICGMIVDDTIVVLENIVRRMGEQEQVSNTVRMQIISDAVKEVAPSVLIATGTTVAAFLPLLLMTGDMGKFISSIPKVAIIALLASLIECFFILPVHLAGHGNQASPAKKPLLEEATGRVADRCVVMVGWLLQHRWVGASILVFVLAVTAGMAKHTAFSVSGATEIRGFRVVAEFDHSSDLKTVTRQLQAAVGSLEEFDAVIAHKVVLAGWQFKTFDDDKQPYLGTIEITLKPDFMTKPKADPIASAVLKALTEQLPATAKISMEFDANQPPSDAPVQVVVYSTDRQQLMQSTATLISQLKAIEGVRDVQDPFARGVREKVFRVDDAAAARYGIGSGDIANLMHLAVTGREVGKMDLGDEVVPVYMMASGVQENSSRVMNHITLRDGRQLPLSSLGTFSWRQSASHLYRKNDMQYVTITGDIDERVAAQYHVQQHIEKSLSELDLPGGSWVEQSGDFSDIQGSLNSMLQASLLSVGLCYLLLTLLCRSYRQPIVLLSAVPLALVGVIWSKAFTGEPLSLFGVAGIVGLIGIVLNDTLVWIDFYNRRRKAGDLPVAAALTTTRLRFRPIVLTTATTVLALLPAAVSGVGIATEIAWISIFGLTAAAFLIVLFFPLLVVAMEPNPQPQWQKIKTMLAWRSDKTAVGQ